MGQNLDSMNQQRSKAELLYDVVVATGNVEAVKALFREGASLEWIDREGKNPLMVACMDRNMIDVAATLIQLGANVNAYRCGRDAGTPLHHAAKEGLLETVKLLLSNGANALVRNDGFQTPLDVARQNRHTNVVRAIESHICYFSGWVRKIPGFLERLFSIKIWVVVTPHGPKDPANPLKLELAAYYTLKDAQPFMVVSLCMTRIEEPNLSESDPKLAIFDNSTEYLYRLAAGIQGDKEQLQLLYNACRGISQVVPSPISQNTQSSVEGAELAMASSDSSAAPNSHTIPEASNTNGWGTSAKDDSYNGSGSALGTTCSEPNSTRWMDEQVKEDTGDHKCKPHGNQTIHSQTCGERTPSVSKNKNVSASVSSRPSAPLIPEEFLDDPQVLAGCHAGNPLHHAAKEGLVETVKVLLSNGANALVRNDDFQTPLDVARQKGHTDVVRAIESRICYFSGWVRQIYGPGFLERFSSYLFSRKIWVVVTPHGPNDPARPLELELAAYYTLKDAQPFMFVYLWMTRIEEPNLSESNPKLAIFDNSTKYRHRLAAAVQGDKEQLQLLYDACRGISQVVPSPISQNTQSSVEGAELATASSDSSAAPNSHTIPEASNANGWGTSAKDESYNGSGSALGTACSEPNSTGWVDEQVKEDTNDHEPKPHGDRTKRSQTCGESTPSVSKKDNVSASVSSSPSPPLIPEEILDEGLIPYPAIDLSWDALSQPTNNETSAYNHMKLGGDSSSCVICWEAPIEGACVPCGHMAGCMSCLNEIKAKKRVCPVCRSKMNEVVRIYAV